MRYRMLPMKKFKNKKTKNVKHVMSEFALSNFIEICPFINLYLHIYIFCFMNQTQLKQLWKCLENILFQRTN